MIKQLILEEVYGNIIIAYHRTPVEDIIDKIYQTGWIPKDNQNYGTGFYGVLSLDSQLKDNMVKSYGQYILKARIDITNFIVLDYDVFIKTKSKYYPNANKDNYIELQFKKYNIRLSDDNDGITTLRNYAKHNNVSGIMTNFFRTGNNNTLKIDGIIYSERSHNDSIVCYDLSLIHPLGISKDNGNTFIPISSKDISYHKNGFINKHLSTDLKEPNINVFIDNIRDMDINKIKSVIDKNIDKIIDKKWDYIFRNKPELVNIYPDKVKLMFNPTNISFVASKYPHILENNPELKNKKS